jgi:hypothetical protein
MASNWRAVHSLTSNGRPAAHRACTALLLFSPSTLTSSSSQLFLSLVFEDVTTLSAAPDTAKHQRHLCAMSTRTAPTASSPSGPQAQNAGTGTGENTRHGTISSSWTIGQSVRIKTAIGEVIEGRIFSYDLICGCLVIDILYSLDGAG